jgi:hypothetical protein
MTKSKPRSAGKADSKIPVGASVRHFDDLSSEAVFSEITVRTYDGSMRSRVVERSVVSQPSTVRKLLYDLGVNNCEKAAEEIAEAVQMSADNSRYVVSQIGWYEGKRFAWPGRVFRSAGRKVSFLRSRQTIQTYGAFFKRRGNVRSWRGKVEKHASKSSFVIFAFGVVFAAPMMRFVGASEGAIFNIVGPTSLGKTTILLVAQSLMGRPDRNRLKSWYGTLIGLGDSLAAVKDFALIIDDTSRKEGSAKEKSKVIENLAHIAAGGGKRSVSASWELQHGPTPSVSPLLVLSSGEHTLQELAEAGGEVVTGGAAVRFIDIPIPDASSGGVFDRLTRRDTADGVRQALERGCKRRFGAAFRTYVCWLEANKLEATRIAKAEMLRFLRKWRKNRGVAVEAPAESRIVKKFALVYAGLRLAKKAGVLSLDADAVFSAVLTCLSAALHQSSARQALLGRAIDALREVLRDDGKAPLLAEKESVGDRQIFKRSRDGVVEAFISEGALNEALRPLGLQAASIMPELDRLGAFGPGKEGRKRQMKVGEKKKKYFYPFRGEFWDVGRAVSEIDLKSKRTRNGRSI